LRQNFCLKYHSRPTARGEHLAKAGAARIILLPAFKPNRVPLAGKLEEGVSEQLEVKRGELALRCLGHQTGRGSIEDELQLARLS
jgi:hypothetical protein